MKNMMWLMCLMLCCFFLTVFCGNYTYYAGEFQSLKNSKISCWVIGFAYNNVSLVSGNYTIDTCVCQCLLNSGCSALNFFNATGRCSLVSDSMITENEVSLNTTAVLLLVSATLDRG